MKRITNNFGIITKFDEISFSLMGRNRIYKILVTVISVYFFGSSPARCQNSVELHGDIISYDRCNDSQYPVKNAFDNNTNTYFRSCAPFGNWIGYDLGSKYIITSVAYCPRIDSDYRARLQLGVFEGANQPDFGDAITLFVITGLTERVLSQQKITCSRGFRYVRIVFPYAQTEDKSCYISELKFYGHNGEGNNAQLPQITNLPTISIHTENAADITSKTEYIKGIISVIYNAGTQIYLDSLEIRGRGNNSWTHPKKPYRIKLAESTHLMGLPAKAKNWTLINSYGDKTLMRNILAFDFSKRIEMPYTSPAIAVDVVLNGDYKGCYLLCDQIDVREKRVDIPEINTENLTGGYLVEIDAYADDEAVSFTSTNYNIPVAVKYPDDDEITTDQLNFITTYFNRLTNSVINSNYTNALTGFRRYLDVETFLKHFLVGEYSGNTDTYWSVYMTKRPNDDKFYFGPVWDFDLAFENDSRTFSITDRSNHNNQWISLWNESSAAGDTKSMINRILSDSDIQQRLKLIYAHYRDNNRISKEISERVVDSCATLLSESKDLNFKRWQMLNEYIHMNPAIYGSYEGEVDNVRNYISNRIDWLDKKLDYIPGASSLDNTTASESIRISKHGNVLHIENIPPENSVIIMNLAGIICFKSQNTTETTIHLNNGIYMITIKTHNYKYIYKQIIL